MDCEKVGKLIQKLRNERGLTQKNIADALGMDADYYVTIDHPMTKEHFLVFAAYEKTPEKSGVFVISVSFPASRP